MLDHVEEAHSGKGLSQDPGIFQSRPHYLPYTSFDGIAHAVKPWFDKHYIEAAFLNRVGDAAISTADIKDGALRGEKLNRLKNAAVSVFKPER